MNELRAFADAFLNWPLLMAFPSSVSVLPPADRGIASRRRVCQSISRCRSSDRRSPPPGMRGIEGAGQREPSEVWLGRESGELFDQLIASGSAPPFLPS